MTGQKISVILNERMKKYSTWNILNRILQGILQNKELK